jgi:hypothetical protein
VLDRDEIFHFLLSIFHLLKSNFKILVSLLFVDNFSDLTIDFFLRSVVVVAVVNNIVHDHTVNQQHDEISKKHASVRQREGIC